MLQKRQLQRVNLIGKLTVGKLTQKDGRDCPSCWTGADWLASPIGSANAVTFSAHAHEVGHSSWLFSISVIYLCNNLWSERCYTVDRNKVSLGHYDIK